MCRKKGRGLILGGMDWNSVEECHRHHIHSVQLYLLPSILHKTFIWRLPPILQNARIVTEQTRSFVVSLLLPFTSQCTVVFLFPSTPPFHTCGCLLFTCTHFLLSCKYLMYYVGASRFHGAGGMWRWRIFACSLRPTGRANYPEIEPVVEDPPRLYSTKRSIHSEWWCSMMIFPRFL